MINLDKGAKISLAKDLGGLTTLRLGVGWFPKGYIPRRFREQKQVVSSNQMGTVTKPTEKKGFFNKLGDMLKGDARLGDVVNAGVDSIKDTVNMLGDNFDESIYKDAFEALEDVDVDTTVIVLKKGQIIETASFANCKRDLCGGGIYHHGDNTTGKGKDMEGDKEQIDINFEKLERYDAGIDELIMFVNVFNASSKGQHFGAFGGGFARLSNQNSEELAFFNLNEKNDKMEGIYLLRVYKYNSDWRIETLGIPVRKASHFRDMVEDYRRNGLGR
jgi:stress response protein SCP2